MYQRKLDLPRLLSKASYFLFGPRSVGKSSLIKAQLPQTLVFDLLDEDVCEELSRRPRALGEKIGPSTPLVVIDEIQKIPKLLDEVHRLMEERSIRFLLTGSSSRKLKRGGANLLGGRAREMHLYPLVFEEIADFDLLKYLNFGGIPSIYLSAEPLEDLKAYGRLYLAEEIKAEAAVRNYDRFVRFMETMALSNGREINYQNLSNDSGIPPRTIETHIEILKDTLIGFELLPFQKTVKRKATTKSKFYFFDCGVANYFSQRLPMGPGHTDLGVSFEQFIIQEVRAYLAYARKEKSLSYWRTRGYEVDLIVGRELAVETKFSDRFHPKFLKGLLALKEEGLIRRFLAVGRFSESGTSQEIGYLGYREFLRMLWAGQIL
jgi:predicted AAA+ superfamily ATPase